VVQVEPSLVLPYGVKGGLVQGRNLRDQQKLLLVGQSSCCCLFTRETPLRGPPGYRLVQSTETRPSDRFISRVRSSGICPRSGAKPGAVGSIESKEFVTGDSLKAKKLRIALSRRRRAKANTGGRPRLSYFNTLCAHQY
jgi:hypothetical protein